MEDDQQFCLRWNNHQSTLIQNFDTLLESGTLVDCTLAAEGKYLKAHKVVLSACSPYFEGLLSEHYDKHPVFILKDVKFKELKAMMDYMYRGEVNISQDQLAALLKAAESLQIKGLSESKNSGSSGTKADTRQLKVSQTTALSSDIPHASSGLTIEKNNKVPRQSMVQPSVSDLPEDSTSPQISKGLSSREGSQSPTGRKRKRFRRRSLGDDNSVENHEASNSSDMPQQMGVPALGIAPVTDEKTLADSTDSLGRSTLVTQLTKPAEDMLQMPLEKPEPNDNLIEPKSEYLDDPEESVEDLTLDDEMNDDLEQDNNRAGPSHDPSQHPAGLASWHNMTGDRNNAGGVVGPVAGATGAADDVFLAAQEAAQAHRDPQDQNNQLPQKTINNSYDDEAEWIMTSKPKIKSTTILKKATVNNDKHANEPQPELIISHLSKLEVQKRMGISITNIEGCPDLSLLSRSQQEKIIQISSKGLAAHKIKIVTDKDLKAYNPGHGKKQIKGKALVIKTTSKSERVVVSKNIETSIEKNNDDEEAEEEGQQQKVDEEEEEEEEGDDDYDDYEDDDDDDALKIVDEEEDNDLGIKIVDCVSYSEENDSETKEEGESSTNKEDPIESMEVTDTEEISETPVARTSLCKTAKKLDINKDFVYFAKGDHSATAALQRTKKEEFICPVCNKGFKRHSSLKSHKSNDCCRIYLCDCGDNFPYRSSFCRHKKTCKVIKAKKQYLDEASASSTPK